jgi:NAD(P)-dependent dehydrogenase (short-subunit alcohol dehydrogenase family)
MAVDSALLVNLQGTFLAVKYEIPAMLGGAIVYMSSAAAFRG